MTRRADRGERTERAKALRRQPTDAERRLWSRLRGQRVAGCKFRRQHPIGPFVVDFVCLEAWLVIEVDGSQHRERIAYDEARTRFLEDQGYRVERFWSNEVLTATDAVVEQIWRLLSPSPRPSPLHGGEGG